MSPSTRLRRWPPVLWILVAVGSELILMGSTGNRGLMIAGVVVAVAGLLLALRLALGRWPGRPRHPGFYLAVGGVVLFYVICAVVAGLTAGAAYGIAALLAGVVPTTAVALIAATARAKTEARDGHLRDASGDAADDPMPGLGLDDERPLGDSPEVHDDLSPHDLPVGHPARRGA